jgi:hypothetical protein
MTPAALEALLGVVLPPLHVVLCERYFQVRRDPVAPLVAAGELATVERIRARLALDGHWN